MRKFICLLLTLVLVLGMAGTASALTGNTNTPGTVYNPFTDIERENYIDNETGIIGFDAVMWAYTNGVTSGLSKTYFGLNEDVTRGQVVTFLWRYMGSPTPTTTTNPFKDVKSTDYFYKAVLWAVENEICTGTSATTFSPNQTCSYAHLVTFLHRTQGCPDYKHNYSGMGFLISEFTRGEKQWYTDAALWAGTNGILSSMTPSDRLTNRVTTKNIVTQCPRQDVVNMLYTFDAQVNNGGYYPQIALSNIMKNPKTETPNVTKVGRDNGKTYYISLDAAGTKLLRVIDESDSNLITVDPYGATKFRATKVGPTETINSIDLDPTKILIAKNHPQYSIISQHHIIQYDLGTRVAKHDPARALDIAGGKDAAGSWVIGYPIIAYSNECFDFEAGANGSTYIKSLGGNYVSYVEGTGLVLAGSKAEATAFYFMPVAQFGK